MPGRGPHNQARRTGPPDPVRSPPYLQSQKADRPSSNCVCLLAAEPGLDLLGCGHDARGALCGPDRGDTRRSPCHRCARGRACRFPRSSHRYGNDETYADSVDERAPLIQPN
jgi:hypothetical protein